MISSISAATSLAEIPNDIPTGKPLASIFGIRHLSPGGAVHLLDFLNKLKPKVVLIEGPSDANHLLPILVDSQTKPPISLLAYTEQRPVRSILYPLANYSPEWVAIRWAMKHKKICRFIDLPASAFLNLDENRLLNKKGKAPTTSDSSPGANPSISTQLNLVNSNRSFTSQNFISSNNLTISNDPSALPGLSQRQDIPEANIHTRAYLDDPYEEIAKLSGHTDYESWWESHFEHLDDSDAYRRTIFELGYGLRSLRPDEDAHESLLRESFMRRQIRQVLQEGYNAEEVVVVCGAFHTPALIEELEPMNDQSLAKLKNLPTQITLMPYSYYRLSSQSGYGAGNHAPGYFEALFEALESKQLRSLPSQFLTQVCHRLRKMGMIRSSAEVIDAVRLADSLAALKNQSTPTLQDLHDAATTCLGGGDFSLIRAATLEIEIGHAFGKLPKGVVRTSIQNDFYLQLEELNLEKYQTEKTQLLDLDLRENRYVQKKDNAFRDLNRSTFFHRLIILNIPFATPEDIRQQQATWKESWNLRWTPDSEIHLVETSLIGDSIEMACSHQLQQRLRECQQIDQAADLVADAAKCDLSDTLEKALQSLQVMSVETHQFVSLAKACSKLGEMVRYGSVRKINTDQLKPLLGELFLRATLSVFDSCVCDDDCARTSIGPSILNLVTVAQENSEWVDALRWDKELRKIAATDSLNSYLSGLVLSIILSEMSEEKLVPEIQRRLSLGCPPDISANWFEGLVQNNREALFTQLVLWRELDSYLVNLEEGQFMSVLVPLRRAFGAFSVGQLRRVVSCLVEVNRSSNLAEAIAVDIKLSDEEAIDLQNSLGDLGL